MKAILLVAGLLGACNIAAADTARDSFLTLRVENYFLNPLAFPEPGMDILAASQPLPAEQIDRVIAPERQDELMRGGSWLELEPKEDPAGAHSGPGLWWLLASTLASLALGSCVSVAGGYGEKHRQRRRVKTHMRKMASC